MRHPNGPKPYKTLRTRATLQRAIRVAARSGLAASGPTPLQEISTTFYTSGHSTRVSTPLSSLHSPHCLPRTPTWAETQRQAASVHAKRRAADHLPRPPIASSPSAPASAVKASALAVPRPPAAVPVPRRAPVPAVLRATGGSTRRGVALVASAALDDLRPAIDEYPEGVLSGEWPENFSLLSYADLRAYLESQIATTGEMSPTAKLGDVMTRPVRVATPGQRLAEVDAFFAAQQFSGLPVVDEEGRCVGVISNKDKAKAINGMESTIGQVMSSPAITLTSEKTVLEAAALMLKAKIHRIPVVNQQQQVIGKIHRIPVVNQQQQVIGIVTRTDVFQALEANNRA